jgi:hypothetical protein
VSTGYADPRNTGYAQPHGSVMPSGTFPPTESSYVTPVYNRNAYADPYAQTGPGAASQRSATTMAPSSSYQTSASAPVAPGYPPTTQAQTPTQNYYQQVQLPSTAQTYAPVQPQDPFYGRGAYSNTTLPTSQAPSDYVASPAGTSTQQASYGPTTGQQYDETPSIPRTSAPSSNTQMASSGTSTSTSSRRTEREAERHADRHGTERRHRPAHRN